MNNVKTGAKSSANSAHNKRKPGSQSQRKLIMDCLALLSQMGRKNEF